MAIPNYYPVNYQPYVPQYTPQFQPTTPSSSVPQNGILWVNNAREADQYPIAPNNAVALWETSGKRIYVKSADATGRPTVKAYDLVEHVDAEIVDEPKREEYALKDDLASVISVLNSLRSDVDSMKSDIYGIAGKKRTSKKVEVIDDDE